ncbi:MAG TPA: thioredoxin family protein, partial [Planctomycetota bacterium]|nr:thioredoxin family protein [Planctomycetota bacterium]
MPSTHPHFDDRGAVVWQTRYEDALRAARAEGKRLFVEFGREQCGQCRALVQSVVPRPEIAALLTAHFVCLASDCDDPEPEVEALATALEDATMLPFVLFADADGRFLEGSSGAVD